MSNATKKQSNPFSTGGGGVNFENLVQSAFVVTMLTRSNIPCLPIGMWISKIKFQAKYDQVETDDIVITAKDQSSLESRLLIQIKHQVTISESDQTFSDVMLAAWTDFNKETFNKNVDKIILIVGPLPKNDINSTIPILEWAKFSLTAEEFMAKSTMDGFTSKEKINKLNILRSQLIKANKNNNITNESLWLFLRCFNIISYDFDSSSSTHVSLINSIITLFSGQDYKGVLDRILTQVRMFNQSAGTIDIDNLPQEFNDIFINTANNRLSKGLSNLIEHTKQISDSIMNTISGVHINRELELNKLSEMCNENNFVFVTGERGVGKSSIVKDYTERFDSSTPVFYLRAQDIDKNSLNEILSSLRIELTFNELTQYFSMFTKKILVIESMEKVLELKSNNVFCDLINFFTSQSGWTIVGTCRNYAYQQILFAFIENRGVSYGVLNVNEFSQAEMSVLKNKIPQLTMLINNKNLSILQNAYYLSLAVRSILKGAYYDEYTTEEYFKDCIWKYVISNEVVRKDGLAAKRRDTIISISMERSKRLRFSIDASSLDQAVIDVLEADGLLERVPSSCFVSLSHDMLEDLAIEKYIELKYCCHNGNVTNFIREIGCETYIRRAFGLWLRQQLKSQRNFTQFINTLIISEDVDERWKDETIIAILQCSNPNKFINELSEALFKDNCNLLIKFCSILNIACQEQYQRLGVELFRPYGNGWQVLITFINRNLQNLHDSSISIIIQLLLNWSHNLNVNNPLPSESIDAFNISLNILNKIKGKYNRDIDIENIIRVFLKVSTADMARFQQLVDSEVFIPKEIRTNSRLRYVRIFTDICLNSFDITPWLSSLHQKFIINLFLHEIFTEATSEEQRTPFDIPSRTECYEAFGFNSNNLYHPASALKGPFTFLLASDFELGLNFILDLCNKAIDNYISSEFSKSATSECRICNIELQFEDGSISKQYSSPFLWKGYRGFSVLPYVLQSALMALENRLIKYVEESSCIETVDSKLEFILKNSNSVLITAIVASIVTGFPHKVKKTIYTILRCKDLYLIDVERLVQEFVHDKVNWFAMDIMRGDEIAKLYSDDRITSSNHQWRKQSLKTLLFNLQIDETHKVIALEILKSVQEKATIASDNILLNLLESIDLNNYSLIKCDGGILIEQTNVSPQLKESRHESVQTHNVLSLVTNLMKWSDDLINKNLNTNLIFRSHVEAFSAAKSLYYDIVYKRLKDLNHIRMSIGPIHKVISLSLLNNHLNMSTDDLVFCQNVIFDCVTYNADSDDNYDVTDANGAATCAYALPIFLKSIFKIDQQILLSVIAIGLTHKNHSVRISTAKGIRDLSWNIDSSISENLLITAIRYAELEKDKESLGYKFHNNMELIQEYQKKLLNIRTNVGNANLEYNLDKFSIENVSMWYLDELIYAIPIIDNIYNKYIQIFKIIIYAIIQDELTGKKSHHTERIHYKIKQNIEKAFAYQIAAAYRNEDILFDEILYACKASPNFLYALKVHFDVEMGRNYKLIWKFWTFLTKIISEIIDKQQYNQERLSQDEERVLNNLLFNIGDLHEYDDGIDYTTAGVDSLLRYFKDSSANKYIVESMAYFLYRFPDLFFKRCISILADKYRQNPSILFEGINTQFRLEMGIKKYILEAKEQVSQDIHEDCLILIDALMKFGTPQTYYLREFILRYRIKSS